MKITIKFLSLVVVLAIGIFFFKVWGQTEIIPTSQKLVEKTKMADVSPELRDKAFGLLVEIIK